MKIEAAIRAVAPSAPQEAIDSFSALVSAKRTAALIGQCAHESGGFKRLTENLNYSAKRLTQVWPKRFPTLESADPFAHNPEALANKTYGGRMGNVNPGDGWRFLGRGYLQLTGRNNYQKFGKMLGIDLEENPDRAAEPALAWRIAAAFMDTQTRNGKTAFEWADLDDVRSTTMVINGGTHGLDERQRLTNLALMTLTER